MFLVKREPTTNLTDCDTESEEDTEMRRRRLGLYALFMTLAMLIAACGPGTSGQTTTTPTTQPPGATTTTGAGTTTSEVVDWGPNVDLTLGHGFAAAHPISVGVLERWAEEVERVTEGTVTVNIIPGGAMGPAPGTYENTVVGGQDLGWALQGYTPGRFPITQLVEAPFVFGSAMEGTEALWDLYEEFQQFQDEYNDVKVLGLWVHDVGDLWVKAGPIDSMDDITGLRLRSPGPMSGRLIEELGGQQVGMPAPEIYDSLASNVIDGLMIAVSALTSFNLYDQLNYGITCNCYVAAQYFVMNLDSWDSLSPAQQAAIDSIGARETSRWGAEVYDREFAAADQRATTEGIERFVLSSDPTEEARWFEAGQRVVDEWIAAREAANVPGQAMWDRLLQIIGR